MGINLHGNGNDTYSHGNLFPSSFQRMQVTVFSEDLWKENCGLLPRLLKSHIGHTGSESGPVCSSLVVGKRTRFQHCRPVAREMQNKLGPWVYKQLVVSTQQSADIRGGCSYSLRSLLVLTKVDNQLSAAESVTSLSICLQTSSSLTWLLLEKNSDGVALDTGHCFLLSASYSNSRTNDICENTRPTIVWIL